MLWLTILVLQAVLTSAPNPGNRRYRNYRYGKYSSTKYQTTVMTLYPRCRSDYTILDILVLDQSGKTAGRTKLWVVGSTGIKEAWTGNDGHARIQVSGCQAGVIVWMKGKQSKYQSVNLDKCKDRIEKVVIKINVACDFLIRAVTDSTDELDINQKSEMISYVANSGGTSTSGSFVGGSKSSAVCIPVSDGDSVYVVISTQSSELSNVLYLSSVKKGTDALVSIPYPVEFDDKSGGSLSTDFSLMVILNLWKYDPNTGLSVKGPQRINEFYTDSQNGGYSGTGYFTTAQIEDVHDENEIYVVSVSIRRSQRGPRRTDFENDMKGNAVLIDKKGNKKIIEYPGLTDDKNVSFWILGCMRDCLDTFKEKSQVRSLEAFPDGDDILTFCNLK